MSLPEFAIKRPVTTAMILIGLAVFGVVSFFEIPLEFLPNVDDPQISVYVPYESSTPAEIERTITIPLEESLSTVTGIKAIKSSSRENSARITMEYEIGADLELAMVEIRDRIDRVRDRLPSDIRQIIIHRFSYSQIPIMVLTLTSDLSKDELARKIDDVLKKRIERLDGISEVNVYGVPRRQIDIKLRLSALRAHNVNIYQVSNDLRRSNINMSAGYIIDGGSKYYIRSLGQFSSIDEIRNIPIGNGRLRLKDISDVKYEFPEKQTIWKLDGKEAIAIVIDKDARANIVEVTNKIKDVLDSMKTDKQLNSLYAYPVWDASTQVRQSLDILKTNGLIGAMLVVLILFVFLRKVRSIIIVSVAIPLSIVIAFAGFYLINKFFNLEFSLNIISMMGLILSIGMLVDNSVVVIESIFRHKEDGLPARKAAVKGSKEIVTAVFAATLTTVAVFLALIFSSNTRSGMFMRDFGISVAVVMFSSLFVALTLVPMASSLFYKKFKPKKDKFRSLFVNVYSKVIKGFLRFRWITLIVTSLLLLYSYNLYRDMRVNFSFGTPSRTINVQINFASGLGDGTRHKVVNETENLFLAEKEKLELKALSTRYDRNNGTITLYLTDVTESKRSTEEIKNDVVKLIPTYPGVVFKAGGLVGYAGQISITLRIKGRDRSILEMIGKDLEKELSDIYGSKNVEYNLESGDDRMLVSLNRIKSRQYGLSPLLVGYSLFSAFGERPITYYRKTEREIPIRIHLRDEDRTGLSSLSKMGLYSTGNASIPLETIADLKKVRGPITYEREDKEGIAQIRVSSDLEDFFLTAKGISKMMDDYQLPVGYTWGFGESWLEQIADTESSNFAIIFAVIMIYIVMVALFESFVHPFTIMSSIPFAFIGTYLLMYITDTGVQNMTHLGFLVLMGIVVNNAIVLIDYTNRLRKQGIKRKEAIIIAGRHRLRPIVITAMTTILALLPMAAPILAPGIFGKPEIQGQDWAPTAVVLIGGLTMSTFLTLLVTPCIYTIIDDISRFIKRIFVKA